MKRMLCILLLYVPPLKQEAPSLVSLFCIVFFFFSMKLMKAVVALRQDFCCCAIG